MLHTKNISKTFSQWEEEITFPDLNISKGDIMILTWASGTGKTTFLKILAGLDDNYSWEVKIETDTQNMWFFFHDYKLIPDLNINENIFLGNLNNSRKNNTSNSRNNDINNIAEKLGVAKLLNKKIKKLSSGEYQRICLIRTCIWEKEIIILDEPTSHLDSLSAINVYDLIADLSKKWVTFIIVTNRENTISYLREKIPQKKILYINF